MKYNMDDLPEFVTLERFRQEVELWRHKGHINVIEICFTDVEDNMILIVPDYVYPDKFHCITVAESLK